MQRDEKKEIAQQWDRDPCGASTASIAELESAAWYESVRRYRYDVYAPWLPQAMRFDRGHNKDVLEIGAGLGSDHLALARAGARMTVLDLSREHLRHTVKHLSYYGYSTCATLGDAEHIPFPDASFDLVYSFGVLHHTPGTDLAIAEVRRVLRPGGVALIGVYHKHSFFFWLSTMCVNGILKMGLLRKGWRRLLSEIEYRSSDNDAVPLVKVYSRRQARALFRAFDSVRVTSHHVEASHFPFLGPWVGRRVRREWFERHLARGGWYLVIEASKAAPSGQV